MKPYQSIKSTQVQISPYQAKLEHKKPNQTQPDQTRYNQTKPIQTVKIINPMLK